MLVRKLNGHYGYFGVTGNINSLQEVRHHVRRIWHAWLSRRSQRAYVTWPRMLEILERYPLPEPRIVPSRL